MELVKRYIAAVQRELPQAKRDEIGRELNANIMDQLDMLSEQQGELTDTDIAAVLKQMGHPRTVAQQFVPPQPLISPGYMALYKNTLFMVLGVLFLLQVVDSTSAWLGSSQMSFLPLNPAKRAALWFSPITRSWKPSRVRVSTTQITTNINRAIKIAMLRLLPI